MLGATSRISTPAAVSSVDGQSSPPHPTHLIVLRLEAKAGAGAEAELENGDYPGDVGHHGAGAGAEVVFGKCDYGGDAESPA
jgi:hypothetical protein